MIYREHPPCAALSAYVACYWTMEPSGAPHRVLPDGCFDLLFDVGAARADVVGVMTTAIVTPPGPPSAYFGVRFRPGMELAFAGIAARETRDQVVDLGQVWGGEGRALGARVAAAASTPARVAIADAFLLERRARARHAPDARVRAAVRAIESSVGRVRVPELARALSIGERQLERAFDLHVGLGPKALARVVRMRAAIDALRAGVPFADAALRAGYADQAHMTRELRVMAGATPRELARDVGFVQAPSARSA